MIKILTNPRYEFDEEMWYKVKFCDSCKNRKKCQLPFCVFWEHGRYVVVMKGSAKYAIVFTSPVQMKLVVRKNVGCATLLCRKYCVSVEAAIEEAKVLLPIVEANRWAKMRRAFVLDFLEVKNEWYFVKSIANAWGATIGFNDNPNEFYFADERVLRTLRSLEKRGIVQLRKREGRWEVRRIKDVNLSG